MDFVFIYPEGAEEFGIQRALSQKERDAIPDHLFAWPDAPDGPEYPIDTQEHLNAAATLLGKAPESEQSKIKERAIALAKEQRLILPDTWQEGDKQERTLTVPEHLQLYMPITRADEKEWIVEGQATSEAVDSYGTIFEYESSKRAFQEWIKRGNIREQHDFHKAVGKALGVEFDDANKIIYVRARISKGARDTWEKILDGTLSGYSISVPADAKMRYIERGNRRIPQYYDFRLAELSVVDAPGSPNCDIRPLVRADGAITDLVDDIPDSDTPTTTPEPQPEPTQPLERAGARMSADTMSKMHQSIAHTLRACCTMMQNCGCDDCCAALKCIDPDCDGDIDLGGYDDPDGDWQSLYNGDDTATQDTERAVTGVIERVLEQKFSYVLARFQSIAGTLARANGNAHTSPSDSDIESLISGTIIRAVDAATTANESSLAEVRADLSAVKEQVDRIADTPLPGAPVMNANSLNRPVDKRLATDPYDMPRRSGSAVYDAVAALSSTGHLDTVDKQVDAVAAALAAQRRG